MPTSDSATADGDSVWAIPDRYSRTLKIWLPGSSPATTASQINAYARPMISPRVVITDSTRKVAVDKYGPTMFGRADANVMSIAVELAPTLNRAPITVDGTIRAAVSVPATSDLARMICHRSTGLVRRW